MLASSPQARPAQLPTPLRSADVWGAVHDMDAQLPTPLRSADVWGAVHARGRLSSSNASPALGSDRMSQVCRALEVAVDCD